jgi:hypothetical protein
MIKRILKMLGALGANTGLMLVTQLLLPPAFLHYYGVTLYGEWIVLSGTLSYLSTLNFGITTYASNELTMLRKRADSRQVPQAPRQHAGTADVHGVRRTCSSYIRVLPCPLAGCCT